MLTFIAAISAAPSMPIIIDGGGSMTIKEHTGTMTTNSPLVDTTDINERTRYITFETFDTGSMTIAVTEPTVSMTLVTLDTGSMTINVDVTPTLKEGRAEFEHLAMPKYSPKVHSGANNKEHVGLYSLILAGFGLAVVLM